MMKKILLFIPLFLNFAIASAQIRDIDVHYLLREDGSAFVTERWDVYVSSDITEWFIPRDNLGDMVIDDLSVTDESGTVFFNEGEWDVNRSRSAKAGRCGIVHKGNDAIEMCWGAGHSGDRLFTVTYSMTNVVKSMNDYDAFHIQCVNRGLDPSPKHARVTVGIENYPIDSSDTKIWAYGYSGIVNILDGSVVAETTERFSGGSSMILLLRFEKGIFDSSSIDRRYFSERLDEAMEGNTYDRGTEDEDDGIASFMGVVVGLLLPVLSVIIVIASNSSSRKKRYLGAFGTKEIDSIGWSREVPYGGDIEASYHVLKHSAKELMAKSETIAPAIILKLFKLRILYPTQGPKGRPLIHFDESADRSMLSVAEESFYQMLLESSGGDRILQEKEFSSWASSRQKRVYNWVAQVDREGVKRLEEGGFLSGGYTSSGVFNNRNLIGFRKFLTDFTLISERSSSEAAMWEDYMVFGALFGIADKVAKELKDIKPEYFAQIYGADYDSFTSLVITANMFGNMVSRSAAGYSLTKADGGRGFSGGGGFSSFGGGGGFSGGGFGGGGR